VEITAMNKIQIITTDKGFVIRFTGELRERAIKEMGSATIELALPELDEKLLYKLARANRDNAIVEVINDRREFINRGELPCVA
jgi:hypothetical protein